MLARRFLSAAVMPRMGMGMSTRAKTTVATSGAAPTSSATSTSSVAPVDDQTLASTLVIHSETASERSPTTTTGALISPDQIANLPPAYVASGVPDLMVTRKTARIFRPAKNAMQSGAHETRLWSLDFDTEEKWENKLMGYVSSGDPVQATRIRFHHKEEAILFAEKQGWDYIVQEDQQATFKRKSYADNYKYRAGKLRIVQTK